jgi:restriction system protein
VGPIVGIVGILLGSVVAVSAAAPLIAMKLRGTKDEPADAADDSAIVKRQRRDGRAFERVVAEHFRAMGYEVEETGTHGRGGDRGVDLILRRVDQVEAVCVQCKDFADWKVSVEKVRAFAGAVALRGAGHVGWIVTSGRFTADAVRDARELGIRLIDGEAWTEMVGSPEEVAAQGKNEGATTAVREAQIPICSRCKVAMVWRTPRDGRKAFRAFWGCANYPRCLEKVEAD